MKIKFIPLLNLTENGAVCSILKINEISIMLDCGINERYDYSKYAEHQEEIKKVDYILLSHSEIQYTGAIPYVFLELECQATIYTTLPISDLSLVNIFDFFIIRISERGITNVDFYRNLYKNIAVVYDKIKEVKYFQHIVLKGVKKQEDTNKEKEYEFNIKPYPIGHTVGACAWCIDKQMRNILYMVSYNHADGKSVDGMNISKFDEKVIDLLITNSNNISSEYKKLRDKEKKIKNIMESSLKNGGNIIIACPSAAKIYDVLLLLLDLWPNNKVPCNEPIYICHNFEGLTQIAHSQIEFLKETITEDFYANAVNPFKAYVNINRNEDETEQKKFNNVKLCRSISDNEMRVNGKLIVTTIANLFYGEQRKFFNTNNDKDVLILTEDNVAYREIMDDFIKRKDLPSNKNIFDYEIFEKFEKKNHHENFMAANTEQLEPGNKISMEEQKSNRETFFAPLFAQKKFPCYAFAEKKVEFNDYGEILSNELKEGFERYELQLRNPIAEVTENRVTKFENFYFKNNFQECLPKRASDFHHPSMNIKREIIDLAGLSDGKSMIKIINNINPKHIFVINGSADDNKKMADMISGRHGCEFPHIGQETELEFMSNNIISRVEPEYLGEMKFGTISSKTTDFEADKLRKHEVKLIPKSTGMDIEVKPANSSYLDEEESKEHKVLGDLKLEKFQEFIEEYNFDVTPLKLDNRKAIFKNGALFVNKAFEIRKASEQNANGNQMNLEPEATVFNDAGKIVINGSYSKEYLEIRNLFYKFSNLN